MMALFFHRIRIQRIKIHQNSRVSAAGQCTFFVGLCYEYYKFKICKFRLDCSHPEISITD